jgi:hypothetical protein
VDALTVRIEARRQGHKAVALRRTRAATSALQKCAYWKNYYPTSHFNYCEPDGPKYYGDKKASKNSWCDKYYKEYKKKWTNGEQYYYVHVYYEWKTPDGNTHKWDDWYYCQYHKYDDPKAKRPYFKAWVGYKPTGDHYWEWFYYWKSPTH